MMTNGNDDDGDDDDDVGCLADIWAVLSST